MHDHQASFPFLGIVRYALVALSLAVFHQDASAQSGARKPTEPEAIKIGLISSLTGGAAFPESSMAVRAYFDLVNEQGGIQGRKLTLIEVDDQSHPEKAAAAAKHLLFEERVVANVGSASALECSVNHGLYRTEGLVSIQGTGVDPYCFGSPNISPVNTGPYVGLAMALQFASEILKHQKICVVIMNIPGMLEGYERAIASWKKSSGRNLHHYDPLYQPGTPTRPHVDRAAESGCDAVLFTGVEPFIIDWMRHVHAAGIRGIDWLFLTPAYSADIPVALGAIGDGIYAMSEFTPWSSRSMDLKDWRSVMKRGNVPLTSFSQGGYLAAEIFVATLRTIQGEITRESVTTAFHRMQPYSTPLIGTPFRFGQADRHSSNRAIVPMILREGAWRIAHFDWMIAREF